MTTTFLGIDVSQEKLDFAYLNKDDWQNQTIENTSSIIEEHLQTLLDMKDMDFHVIVESTGTYSSKIVYACCQKGVKLTLINPMQSSAFAKMKHKTTKNDRSDARLLAQYGKTNKDDLVLYKMPDVQRTALRQLFIAGEQLEKMRQQVINQKHAYTQLPLQQQQKIILDIADVNIQSFDNQINQIQEQINQISPPEEDYLNDKELITSVTGIGEKTANAIIAKTNGIRKFKSAKQLAKFMGIAPTEKRSGTSVKGKGHINRSGSKSLRKILYCASWSAIRFNNACKKLYQRLKANGKPTKLALIAVANLLLRQMFATVQYQKPFDNQYFLKFEQKKLNC